MRTAHERAAAIADATRASRVLRAAWRGETMKGEGDLLTALTDTARALADNGVAYAVIGGFAVGMHATPRATVDVDVAVTTSERDRAASILVDAGFELRGTHPHSTNFRHPNSSPVQLTFDPLLDAMITRAEVVQIDDTPVSVVTRADLIESKERAAKDPKRRRSKALQDRADIERLRGDDPDPDEGW